MRRRYRTAAAGLLAATSTAAVVVLLTGAAQAQAPDTAAWWSAANVGNGAPAPPAPPDVPSGDLLVQGSNALASVPTTPLTNAPASSQAVAGLTFQLPANATVGALTLQIDGSPPSGVSIVACRATQNFAAEENGAWSDVPPADCTQTSQPKLTGSKLVFDDISKLAQSTELSVVLLPGALDRVVLKKPDAGALEVTTAGALGTSAPAFGTGSNAGPAGPGGAAAQPVAAVGGGSVLPPPSAASPAVAPPVIAPTAAGAQPGTQNAAATTAAPGSGGLSTTQRRVLAGVVIAAELLGFLLLMADRDVERLALGAAVPAAAGGRLRPPDRVARSAGPAATWAGVGRFRSERVGPPPRL